MLLLAAGQSLLQLGTVWSAQVGGGTSVRGGVLGCGVVRLVSRLEWGMWGCAFAGFAFSFLCVFLGSFVQYCLQAVL